MLIFIGKKSNLKLDNFLQNIFLFYFKSCTVFIENA
jgi:hypothetical protein